MYITNPTFSILLFSFIWAAILIVIMFSLLLAPCNVICIIYIYFHHSPFWITTNLCLVVIHGHQPLFAPPMEPMTDPTWGGHWNTLSLKDEKEEEATRYCSCPPNPHATSGSHTLPCWLSARGRHPWTGSIKVNPWVGSRPKSKGSLKFEQHKTRHFFLKKILRHQQRKDIQSLWSFNLGTSANCMSTK